MVESKPSVISKELSANDTGETGAHQAGICIPKKPEILTFFPSLDNTKKNPRTKITFKDNAGGYWNWSFIYYNNKFYGGTRNEYRLTGMTEFIRNNNLKAGDSLTLFRSSDSEYTIEYRHNKKFGNEESNVLKLGSTWKVIKF
jgi:hypothetical protein